MTTGNRHRVRCTCWWLDATAIDRPPHSSYVRRSGEVDCPAHPTVDLEPSAPYRVIGAQVSLERVDVTDVDYPGLRTSVTEPVGRYPSEPREPFVIDWLAAGSIVFAVIPIVRLFLDATSD